jgi:hypothetical protein
MRKQLLSWTPHQIGFTLRNDESFASHQKMFEITQDAFDNDRCYQYRFSFNATAEEWNYCWCYNYEIIILNVLISCSEKILRFYVHFLK